MARIPPIQATIFDMLDLLYFNQVIGEVFFSDEQKIWYGKIINRIGQALEKRKITGMEAEVTKHYVLCVLEISLWLDEDYYSKMLEYNNNASCSEEAFNKVEKHNIEFSLSLLIAITDQNNIHHNLLLSVREEVVNDPELKIAEAPAIVKHRLVERCFSYEYKDSTLLIYYQLIALGVLKTDKYKEENNKLDSEQKLNVERAFIRACLFIEFEAFRLTLRDMMDVSEPETLVIDLPEKGLPLVKRRELASHYKSLIDTIFIPKETNSFVCFKVSKELVKEDVEKFLFNAGSHIKITRILSGTHGRWIGSIGALLVQTIKTKKHKENNKVAIYCEANNCGTVTDLTSKYLKSFGFTVSARNLYLRHKEFKTELYRPFKYYWICWDQNSLPFSWQSPDIFHEMALQFKYDESKAKLGHVLK